MNLGEVNAGREQKFITLDGAISGLSRAADGLENLISEMQNGPIPTEPEKATKDQPSFQIVYDEASGRIAQIEDRIRKMTEDIRARLF